ncbi:MAG: acyl-CoA dehydrogenase [Gemmatimonadetes bacterium]|nr:acyl-CoA dehydrogenase [Gemmatimonadota bacterium]
MALAPVDAFLDESHHDVREKVARFCAGHLKDHPDPESDAAARERARDLVGAMGAAGLFEPIGRADVRGCLVSRELLAWWSPLADAVFALQGLGATPGLICESDPGGWGGRALAGEAMGGFAMTEWEAGSDVGSMATRAELDGDAYVLSGGKTFISNAGIADYYVVFAATAPEDGSRGLSAFVVPADTPGLVFKGALVMSAPHPLGELAFEECRVPVDHLLAQEGEGFKVGMSTLDRLRPTVAAAACGMAGRALSEALAHAAGRTQFGKPLGSFQLIQDKLASSATELSAARLLTYRAGWLKDGGAERITVEAAMAKAFATEAAQRIVDRSVQILGGRGVMANHPVDHLYRSVRALRIYEGTSEIQQLIIGGQLMKAQAT